jgi:CBS domain containing-hemolysin-like protein
MFEKVKSMLVNDLQINADDIKLESESVMLSGWVMEQTGKIPDTGDTFTYEHLDCTVKETDGHRVISIEVKQNPIEDEDSEKESKKDSD